MKPYFRLFSLAGLLIAGQTAFLAQRLVAQSVPEPDPRDEIIRQLLERVEALEEKAGIGKKVTASMAPPDTQIREAVREVAAGPPQPFDSDSAAGVESAITARPRFSIHGYADLGYQSNLNGDSLKRFIVGEIDLVTSIQLSDRWRAILEGVIQTDDEGVVNIVPIGIERALIEYRANDYLNVEAGSYRTSIGYFGTAYMRGSWLQTAISRPRIFSFEEDNGFLPLHSMGVSISGAIPSGSVGLHYIAETGNSHTWGWPRSTGNKSVQFHGAVNLALLARPRHLPGMQAGISLYRDSFSPEAAYELNRRILAAHIIYRKGRLEFLNEGMIALFRYESHRIANVPGFYSQLGFRVHGSWTPFVRYENLSAHAAAQNVIEQYMPWRNVYLGGARYDVLENLALKVEAGREAGTNHGSWLRSAVQLAFTF